MQMPVEDVSKKILSKQIDKQDAMRLFQSLDKESQLHVLAIVRGADGITPAREGKGAARALKTLDQRDAAPPPGTTAFVPPQSSNASHRNEMERLKARCSPPTWRWQKNQGA